MNSGYSNISGGSNSAVGLNSGKNITTGSDNTYFGVNSGYLNTTASQNTAVGKYAGDSYATDTSCTFIGYGADANGNYQNAGAFGNGAIATARNKYMFGNSTIVGLYTTAAGLFTTSDGRFKTNVTENVKGLAFINKLRPVTYYLDTKALDDFIIQNFPDSVKTQHRQGMDFTASSAKVHAGFIAQEVETAEHQVGFSSSIVSKPSNNTDPYGLNYSEIVVPLVKAVQELSRKVDSLSAIQNPSSSQRQRQDGGADTSATNNSLRVVLSNNSDAILYQNQPNPFGDHTTIRFYIPSNTQKAMIIFYDQYGKELSKVEVAQKGNGSIDVNSTDLVVGIYSYSLIVDGVAKDTKKMIKGK